MVDQADTWSTTGAAKTIDLLETQEFEPNANHNGYEFPGQSALAAHTIAFEAVPIADPGRPASMLYTFDLTKGDDITNPRASIAMVPVPDEAVFMDANDRAFMFHYSFTIPAGGSFTIRKVYASEVTNAALAPLTTLGEDMLASPSVAITSPASDGTTVSAPVLTLSGTDGDNVGVASVTVNGQAATLGSGTFTKDVTLAAGLNTLTVVASDAAGNTASATRTVTYTPPAGGGGDDGGGTTPTPAPPSIAANGTVGCPAGGAACTATGRWTSRRAFAAGKRKHKVVLATWRATIQPGKHAKAKPTLTTAGRRLLRKRSVPAVRVIRARAGTGSPVSRSTKVTLKRLKRTKKH
jgi:hypothetical protein